MGINNPGSANGQAGDRTSDPLFLRSERYQLGYRELAATKYDSKSIRNSSSAFINFLFQIQQIRTDGSLRYFYHIQLVVLRFNATLTAKVISWRSVTHMFPGFSHTSTSTTFLSTCFCRGERRKYTGKKSRLNRGSNSQPPGHESDTLTTEPPGRGKH